MSAHGFAVWGGFALVVGCGRVGFAVGERSDAGRRDAGNTIDAGAPPPDSAAPDAGLPIFACPPASGARNVDPIALYTFEHGDSFAMVADRAPAAPDIPLTGVAGLTGGEVTFDGRSASFVGGHLIASVSASNALHDALLEDAAFTVEAWFSVRDIVLEEANGPERVVSFSEGIRRRSFAFGSDANAVAARVRSVGTDANGVLCLPDRLTSAEFVSAPLLEPNSRPTHVVLTFDTITGVRVYINGTLDTWDYCGSTELNWGRGDRLILGDELHSSDVQRRTLDGSVYRVAIYKRSMTGAEVACWFARGPDAPLHE